MNNDNAPIYVTPSSIVRARQIMFVLSLYGAPDDDAALDALEAQEDAYFEMWLQSLTDDARTRFLAACERRRHILDCADSHARAYIQQSYPRLWAINRNLQRMFATGFPDGARGMARARRLGAVLQRREDEKRRALIAEMESEK